jgi:hypothetical protein
MPENKEKLMTDYTVNEIIAMLRSKVGSDCGSLALAGKEVAETGEFSLAIILVGKKATLEWLELYNEFTKRAQGTGLMWEDESNGD